MATALIGAGTSIVGGLLSNSAQNDAAEAAAGAAAFNPFNVSGAGGNVTFGAGNSVNAEHTGQSAMMQNMFGGMFNQIGSGGAGNQGMIDFGNQVGNNMGQFFDQAGQAGDPSSAVNAANMFSDFSAQNAQFGQSAGMNAMAQANDFGNREGGRNEGLAQQMFGFGTDALNNTDFSALSADQLARSRARARPGEDRAVNSKFQNLFSKGILSATGGQRQLGELALSQEMADINRMDQADRFGNMLGQQNRQFGMAAMQQGQGFRQQDDQFNLSRANMFGNFGQGLLNFGQQSGQQGMGAQFAANNLVNSRGQQRLQNAGQMFGFGQAANQQNFGQMMGMFNANSQGNADLRNLMSLGGNLGAAGANAGNNQGRFMTQGGNSGLGSAFSGFGAGVLGSIAPSENGIFG